MDVELYYICCGCIYTQKRIGYQYTVLPWAKYKEYEKQKIFQKPQQCLISNVVVSAWEVAIAGKVAVTSGVMASNSALLRKVQLCWVSHSREYYIILKTYRFMLGIFIEIVAVNPLVEEKYVMAWIQDSITSLQLTFRYLGTNILRINEHGCELVDVIYSWKRFWKLTCML